MNQRGSTSIITLTTDFGVSSPYVAEMKGVILSVDPTARVVDISHAIRPQDVAHGALVLEQTTVRETSAISAAARIFHVPCTLT